MGNQKRIYIIITLIVFSIFSSFAQDSDMESRLKELEEKIQEMEESLVETKILAQRNIPLISGESKLTFEIDGLTGGTAFTNDNNIDIRIPLISGTEVQRHRGKNLTAMISLYQFDIAATEDGVEVKQGKIDARLMWGDLFLNISKSPDFLLDKAQPIETFASNIRTNSVIADAGFTFGYEGKGSALAFSMGSYEDDARYNYKNQYGFGLNWKQRLIPQLLNIEAGATYGMQLGYIRDVDSGFISKDIGFSLKPILLLKGLGQGIRLNLASDMLIPYDLVTEKYGNFQFDMRFDTELFLSKEGTLDDGSRARSTLNLAVYSVPVEQVLDIELNLTELSGNLGFIPVMGGNFTVALADILRSGQFNLTVSGRLDATFGKVTPYVESSYRTSTQKVGLTVGTIIKPLDKVKFEIEYHSDSITEMDSTVDGAIGTLKFMTTIAY